jgi:uridylate kinase
MGPPESIKRILLKISGECLSPPGESGVDPEVVAKLAAQIQRAAAQGVQIAVVVGAGNLIRGSEFARLGTNRATADQMGMLATAINCLALQDALERLGVETRAASAMEMKTFMEPYVRRRAMRHLEKDRVMILAGGTGNPYFTTDTAAALRATELGVDLILKATKVDGIYTADPKLDPKATKIPKITFKAALDQDLRVMDRTAFTLCMENDMPILVFDMFVDGNLERAVRGESIGTWVLPGD